MGGWRCSYRNCTVRTDGKTHMFHYPVFDKVRCHQWLVNAGRLDFLNLKVSQLKNRVICQHHFSDEQFMNFKRDKLTFDAVPSLNGPYCDASDGETKSQEETPNSLSIILDDIENEYMTQNDKKANYSVKYADFLTSNELADIDMYIVPDRNIFDMNKYCGVEVPILKGNSPKKYTTTDAFENRGKKVKSYSFVPDVKPNLAVDIIQNQNIAPKPEINKRYQTHPVLVVPPYKTKSNLSHLPQEENILEVELPPGFINDSTLLTDSKGHKLNNNFDSMSGNANADDKSLYFTPKPAKKPSKIKILSEKKITEPLNVVSIYMEPVSPNAILPILEKKPAPINQPQEVSNEINLNNQEFMLDVKPPEEDHNKQSKKKVIKEQKVNQYNKVKSPRISLLKNKIPPERIAAIEEKRRFNMKLRDIIETFLDKLDEQDKEIKDSRDDPHEADMRHQVHTTSMHERTIACLEAKIKKMEDTLSSKIDRNAKCISDLRSTIVQPKHKKKSTATQTEKCQKKRLYQEISQYLSPDANSLIYEELFINESVQDVPNVSSAKRKRRR